MVGKMIKFVTNNSGKSRRAMKALFDAASVHTTIDDMFTSSYSAAIYISRVLKPTAPKDCVFLIGGPVTEEELRAEGVRFCGGSDPALNHDITDQDYIDIDNGTMLRDDVGIVLVASDYIHSYLKLSVAYAYLQRGAKLLITNIDPTITMPNKTKFLALGSALAAPLVHATGVQPLSMGKPSPAMLDAIEQTLPLDRQRVCMVGDNLLTDIQFGIDSGLGGTLAVLSGVADKEHFLAPHSAIVPTAYIDHIKGLLACDR